MAGRERATEGIRGGRVRGAGACACAMRARARCWPVRSGAVGGRCALLPAALAGHAGKRGAGSRAGEAGGGRARGAVALRSLPMRAFRSLWASDASRAVRRKRAWWRREQCEFLQCTVLGKHGAVSDDVTLRGRDVILS